MTREFRRFLRDEEGQDLTEYSLLIAVVLLATIGLLKAQVPAVSTIWVPANNLVQNAALAAS